MVLPLPTSTLPPRAARRYLRPPAPLHFPEEEQVPEGFGHSELLVLLWQSVKYALGDDALVSSDQFLYFDPTDPKRVLAPDLAIRLGQRQVRSVPSWKTWELGAPHVGVEIVSDWDRATSTTEQKLERYRQAGILEVVRFEPEGKEPQLRLWDLFDGDLVERDLSDPEARRCDALGCYWVIVEDPTLKSTLRLSRDREGREVLPTKAEAMQAKYEAEKAAASRAAEAARAEKEAALARIAELEAELARKR
jgi:hypothetical protein